MQFKVLSVLALAMVAAAAPAPTDSQEAANKCSQGQTLKCCNQVIQGVLGLPIGLNCVNINCEPFFQNLSTLISLSQTLISCPTNSGCCPPGPMRCFPEAGLLLQRCTGESTSRPLLQSTCDCFQLTRTYRMASSTSATSALKSCKEQDTIVRSQPFVNQGLLSLSINSSASLW